MISKLENLRSDNTFLKGARALTAASWRAQVETCIFCTCPSLSENPTAVNRLGYRQKL